MTAAQRQTLYLAVGFCGLIGLYDVVYAIFTMARLPSIGPILDVLFPDFLVFHAATRAYFEGKLALVYDIDLFTRFQIATYPDRLDQTVFFRPFFYPPIFVLLLLPLGLLGATKAYAVFMTVTAGLATLLEGKRDPWGWLAIVTSPAGMWVILSGQNTFLSVAFLYGGLRLLDRSPLAAGVLLGLLSYKPQIWVVVPVALVAARQWRALAWSIGTVALVSLLSLALFGLDFWLAFLEAAREAASPRVVNEMFENIFMHMTTLMPAMRILGLPPAAAGAVQIAGAVLAIAAVWRAFRRHGSSDARTAVLVTAVFLISPYTLNYDLLLLMPAAVALFRVGLARGFYAGERLLYVGLWLIPTMCMVLNRAGLPITPLIILLFGWIAWLRLNGPAKVELPSAATAG